MRQRLALQRDLLQVLFARVGAAVRQQDHPVDVLADELGGELVRARTPAAMQIGGPAAFDRGQRSGQRQLVGCRCERGHLHDLVVEREDGRAVARRQAVDDVARAALGFLQRHAIHRARAVEHQRQMQRRARSSSRRRRRRLDAGQYAQRGGLPGGDGGLLGREQQLERGRGVVGIGHDWLLGQRASCTSWNHCRTQVAHTVSLGRPLVQEAVGACRRLNFRPTVETVPAAPPSSGYAWGPRTPPG
jgi:hypothetical protein